MSTVDGDVLRIAERLRRLAVKLPVARDVSAQRASGVDGWPEKGESLRGNSTPGVSTSPTEAAAMARLKHGQSMANLDDMVTSLDSVAAAAEHECERIVGHRIAIRYCTGGDPSERGWSSWGDPSCRDMTERPDLDLCSRHRKRRYRWRKANPEHQAA